MEETMSENTNTTKSLDEKAVQKVEEPNRRQEKRPGGIGPLKGLFLATGGWIAYSTFLVNHNVDLPPAMEAERRTFASSGAGILSYYADRNAEGRPIVLIHSVNAAASAFEMRPLFEHFRGKRPVYALDLPGFGFSDRSDRPYTPQLYKMAILDFLNSQVKEGDAPDIIALSLGCEFAAMAALEAPKRVNSLAMISPTGFTPNGQRAASQTAAANSVGDAVHQVVSFPLWGQALYDALGTRQSLRYFLKMNFESEPPEALIEYAYRTSHRPGAKNAPLHFISGRLFSKDIREMAYEKLACPVLVIYDYDPNVRFDMLEQTMANRPHWQMARIVPTRGLPHWEQLAETALALEGFWTKEIVAS
jgi:pimeloyl-ACP methyl ester carboxylesterase